MTNDELAALRTLIREEIGASEQRTRVLIREEVNSAVYASEQRIGERLDRLEGGQRDLQVQVSSLGAHVGLLEGGQRDLQVQVSSLGAHVGLLEGGQRELQVQVSKIEVTLTEAVSVLDLATKVNNDLQASQRAVEIRLEDNIIGLRREMQKLTDTVQRFAEHFIAVNHATNDRITLHEKTPPSATHPYPPNSVV